MKTLIILSHSNYDNSKKNKQAMEVFESANYDSIHIENLYKNGDIDISKEQERLLSYDRIIFQFPTQ